jgi:hypothetical protein
MVKGVSDNELQYSTFQLETTTTANYHDTLSLLPTHLLQQHHRPCRPHMQASPRQMVGGS